MKINIIDIKDKFRWEKVINSKLSLPSYSNDYSTFCFLNYSESPLLLEVKLSKSKIICPINISKYKGYKIIKTLPGYSSFNFDLDLSDIKELKEVFYKNKILTFFSNSSPYSNSKLFEKSNFVSFKNYCYYLDLNKNEEIIKKKINRNIKKNILKTEDLDIKINFCNNIDFEIFNNLYIKTCNRLNLKADTFYSTSALKFLINEYKNKLILTATHKKKIISVSIFLYSNIYSDYLLNFSDDEYNFCTSSLIIKSIQFLKNRSIQFINLGGGISHNDGLEKFKKSFNGVQSKIFTFKIISDSDIYNKFSENTQNNYFPPFIK